MKKQETLLDVMVGKKTATKLEKAKSKISGKDMIRAFSNGTEYELWRHDNCLECKNFSEDINKTCRLEYELALAYLTTGEIKKSSFKEINIPNRCKKLTPLTK